MVEPRRPIMRHVAAPLGLLLAVALATAACGSSTTASSTTASSNPLMGGALSTGILVPNPSTIPAGLTTATSTEAPATSSDGSISVGAAALQSQMVSVIKQLTPAVVVIETDQGLGSGVIYDTAGHIVTNAHVVGTSKTFKVTLSSGKVYTGTLVGSFTPDDIAVIKISAPGLTPAVFGDSSQLAVGDFVLAMGDPLGLQSSVTEGIVSALGRQVSEPTGNALPDAIQTSAAINPGNSGGALVDLNGQVVGIPTLEATDPQLGGAAVDIGFAISSNRAKLVADQLIASGQVTSSGRAYLGVQLGDTNQGVGVFSVVAGGPSDKAGMQAGDLILSIDGQDTPDSGTLAEIVATLHPGDVANVEVQHQNGTKATLNVTLGEMPG